MGRDGGDGMGRAPRAGLLFIVRDYGDLGKGWRVWADSERQAAEAWMKHKHPRRHLKDGPHFVEVHDPRTGMFGMWSM
jgi:hypothetical protein